MKVKTIDLFGGIGGIRRGFELAASEAGVEMECVFYADIDKHAIAVYNHNYKERNGPVDVFKAEPEKIGEYDISMAGFPCFPAGTMVVTNQGEVPIEKIRKGDIVQTMSSWRPVIAAGSREYSGPLVTLEFPYGLRPLIATSNHKIYARRGKMLQSDNGKAIYAHKSVSRTRPEWIEASQLKAGDYVHIPIPSNATNEINVPLMETTDPDFWWVVGLYVADGTRTKRTRHLERGQTEWQTSAQVKIAVNKKETAKILKRVKLAFPEANACNNGSCDIISFSNTKFYTAVSQLGDTSHEKRLPRWFRSMPAPCFRALIEGYVAGDGCITKTGFVQISTVSEELARQVQYGLTAIYRSVASFRKVERPPKTWICGRKVNQRDWYMVRVKRKRERSVMCFNDYASMWVKVSKATSVESQIRVYNLQVISNPTYTANWICVHNCQSFSMIGKREGFTSSTKGTLFFEILRLAQLHKPVMLFLENVKGLMSAQKGYCAEMIMRSLNECGYIPDFRVLNSVDFGVPQNRERVYIVATHSKVFLGKSTLAETIARGILIERMLKVLEMDNEKKDVLRVNGLQWLVYDFVPRELRQHVDGRPELAAMAEMFGGRIRQSKFTGDDERVIATENEDAGEVVDPAVLDWLSGGRGDGIAGKSIWSHADMEAVFLGYLFRNWEETEDWVRSEVIRLFRLRGEVTARGRAKDKLDETSDIRVDALSLVPDRAQTCPIERYLTD